MRRPLIATAFALLAASLVTLPPSDASAQRRGARRLSPQKHREAKRLFDQGSLSYRRGDYEAAILRWQESYDISGRPLIFEAISNAYEKLDNYEAAIEYLRKWRDKAPRREHEVLDARIQSYERQLAKQKAQQEAAAAERRRIEREAMRKAQQQKRQEQSSLSPLPIAGWSLVGTGAAAVITGVVLDGVAASQRPDVNEVCRESQGQLLCSDDDRATIINSNTLAMAGDGLWIGGAALTAGGITLLIVSMLSGDSASEQEQAEPEQDDEAGPDAMLLPLLGPRIVGANLAITF